MAIQHYLQSCANRSRRKHLHAYRRNNVRKKLGFTLTEIIAVMVMISILVYVGSEMMPADALNETVYKIQAERVASGIRWAQSYAINRARNVELLISGHSYSISDLSNSSKPISWPLTYSHCSGNICRLDERVYFPANLAVRIASDGSFDAHYLTETGAELGASATSETSKTSATSGTSAASAVSGNPSNQRIYQVIIPLSTQPERLMFDTLYITLSTVGGLVKVTRGGSSALP